MSRRASDTDVIPASNLSVDKVTMSTGDDGGGDMTGPFFSCSPIGTPPTRICFPTIGRLRYDGDRKPMEQFDDPSRGSLSGLKHSAIFSPGVVD